MDPKKYFENFSCDNFASEFCNCPRRNVIKKIFMDDINDVALTVTDIMRICGIHQCKSKATCEIVIDSFLHYDEIRHRIDTVPRKRLCKEDLIHDLGRKCLMNRMEAQLTYSIIKRAFKAFYYGSGEGGVRNPTLDEQLEHSRECLWVHAAKRTAQVFASYEGMFFSAQKNYEAQIRCIYKRLYDRLQERIQSIELAKCICGRCAVRGRPLKFESYEHTKSDVAQDSEHGTVAPVQIDSVVAGGSVQYDTQEYNYRVTYGDGLEAVSNDEQPKDKAHLLDLTSKTSKMQSKSIDSLEEITFGTDAFEGLENEYEYLNEELTEKTDVTADMRPCKCCNYAELLCDEGSMHNKDEITAECSQGPYKCTWLPLSEDDNDPFNEKSLLLQTQQAVRDCKTCSDCICDCSESCEFTIDEIDELEQNMDDIALSEGIESKDDEDEERVKQEANIIGRTTPVSTYQGNLFTINHIVEEVDFTENPISIALIENHKIAAIVKSEMVNPSKNLVKPVQTLLKPLSAQNFSDIQITNDEKRMETKDVMELLRDLI